MNSADGKIGMPSVASVGAGTGQRWPRRVGQAFCGGSTFGGVWAAGLLWVGGLGKGLRDLRQHGPAMPSHASRRARAAGARRRNASRYYKTARDANRLLRSPRLVRGTTRLVARDHRDTRRSRVAEHRQGRRRPLRRGVDAAPRSARRRRSPASTAARAAITSAPTSPASGAACCSSATSTPSGRSASSIACRFGRRPAGCTGRVSST